MAITFTRLKEYLDKVADKATGDVTTAPHKVFWKVNDAATFRAGVVPNVKCHGAAIPNVDAATPAATALLVILRDQTGFCGKRQMPGGGPFLTDEGYMIKLDTGEEVSGAQVLADIQAWLEAGAPE